MKTHSIRKQINSTFSDEAHTNIFANLLNQFAQHSIGRALNPIETQAYVNSIKAYIQYVPDLCDEAESLGVQYGYENQVRPVLDRIIQYFIQPMDFIPDAMGVVGLLDDAYLAHVYLDRVSDFLEQQTGKRLLQKDNAQMTNFIRMLIGEPIASQLDNFINGQNPHEFMNQLMQLINSGAFSGFGTSFNDYSIKQSVDLQMDLITSSISPSW